MLKTIRSKIVLGYAVVAFALVLSGLFTAWQGLQLTEIFTRVRDIRGPTIDAIMEVASGTHETQSALKSWLLHRDRKFSDWLERAWKEGLRPAAAELAALAPNWTNAEERTRLQPILDKIDRLDGRQHEVQRMPAARTREAVAIVENELIPLAAEIRSELRTILDSRQKQVDADTELQAGFIRRINLLQGVLISGGLLVCILMAIALIRAITGPILRTIELADQVASGDYDTKLEVGGSVEINRLGDALERMRRSLARQAWFSRAQLTLSDVIRPVDNVRELANDAVAAMARAVGANVGALFVVDGKKLRTVGGYSLPARRSVGFECALGEGLAGQTAVSGEIQSVRGADGPLLTTGAGDIAPREVVAVPVRLKDDVTGVLEFATQRTIEDHEREFLRLSADVVGISLNAVQRGEVVKTLLQETQAQSEELQAQQEELRNANDELQTRQEELEATNEELEEQKNMLERQKSVLDERNEELEAAQNELARRAADLDKVSKYKSEFLANMSHELRTPLNSQLILSRLLVENKGGNLTPKQIEFAETIHSTGLDLLRLINDILDLSKVEAGKLALDVRDVALKDIVADCERDFRFAAEQRGLTFEVDIAGGLPESLRTDSLRLGQVLRNFLSNALKFTEKGGITLQVRRPSGTEGARAGLEAAKAVAFSVIDTGIGIPEDKIERVFQAFEQVDSSVSRKYGGTGLGLAISSNLGALLGGEIGLKSELGRGSAFTLVIPEAIDGAAPAKPASTPVIVPPAAAPAKSAKIPSEAAPENRENLMLIIEDDGKFAELVAGMAKEKGFDCLIARDGAEGLELAQSRQPACILLDYKLPQLDGLRVLKELKANPATRHIPVHMVSVEDHAREAQASGAMGFLVKTGDAGELRGVIDRLQENSQRKFRYVLVVDDDPVQLDNIIALIGNGRVKSVGVGTAQAALEQLKSDRRFDCVVLDLRLPDMSGFDLLDRLAADPAVEIPPVVVYTAQELTREEEERLRKHSESIIIKGARSSDRLLDEVSLFIHRVVQDLPQDKQRMLRDLYNPEKVFENKEVLIVDDDVRNIFALSNALEAKGMRVVIARNGQEALNALDSSPGLSIVLMDVMMPVMDGYEAMRRIRRQPRFAKLPILALAAKAMKEDRQLCLDAGANDYLAKPVEMDRLLTLLRVWLTR